MRRTMQRRLAVLGSVTLPFSAAVTVLVAVTVVTVGLGEPDAVSAGPSNTGRITLSPPARIIDTRGTTPIAGGANLGLPAGLLNILATPVASTSGQADVFPCSGQPDAEPTFRFEEPGYQSRSVVVSPDVALCLRSTVALNLIVDRHADVAASPFDGGLQYEPLPTPTVVLEVELQSSLATTVLTIQRGTAVPNSASGATYSVNAIVAGSTAPIVYVYPCGQPPSALTIIDDSGTGVANVPLAPGQQACMSTLGLDSVEVALLGTLNTTGPDPTRLPPGTTSRSISVPPPGFVPITPDRAFDTRTDAAGKLLPTETLEVDLNEYLTPSSTAVTMNVTATGAEAGGYLTVWPCDEDQPNASNLNFERGIDVPNLVTVRLAANGTVCINGSATTHVLGDIAGTYELGDGYGSTPMAPTRIFDTRRGLGGPIINANGSTTLQVAGREGLPASGVQAVTMNVTATGSQADGYLTVWPCDQPRPDASNLNFRRGIDVANLVTVKLSASGTVCFFSTATTHAIADAAMWFSASSTDGYIDVAPTRVLDTRIPIGHPAKGKIGGGYIAMINTGLIGVPAGVNVTSITMNVTVANPDADGYLTVGPCFQPPPDASNVNYRTGTNLPNLVSVRIASPIAPLFLPGLPCIFSTATTDVLADVAGYTTDAPLSFWTVVIV